VGANPVPVQEPVRFADFELDLRAYELRRSGRAVKLERIPMELLLLLVERADEVVTREAIADRIWGKDVCLDTDNSINCAIRKLRQALKDDCEHPRFIHTIPGRGYRFIAPLIQAPAQPTAPPANLDVVAAPAPRRTPVFPIRWVVVLLFLMAALSFFLWKRQTAPSPVTTPGKLMLAVMPFQNLTGDPGQEYFSDGLTEEMIARLGSLNPQRLGVIARTSVMQYKTAPQPLDRVGRELGVQYVLEGTIRRDAGKIRITAQLVQVSDQTTLWSRHFDRELSGLLAVQDNIAKAVAYEIQLALAEQQAGAEPASLSPAGLKAYELYLKGRFAWNRRTPKSLEKAIDYFEQAIAADPGYARAYAGLADSYGLLAGYNVRPHEPYLEEGRTAARRALELAPQLPEAHTSIALIAQNFDRDLKAAEQGYRRAIELDPNYATARHWYAECLALQGRFDEALREIEHARRLDPLSLIIAADHGAILYFARQYDRAIEQLTGVLRVQPDFPRAHLVILAYMQKGRVAEAQAVLEQWAKLSDSPWMDSFRVYVYGRSGRPAKARQALARLHQLNRTRALDPAVFYVAYTGLGMTDEAFQWIEKGIAQRSPSLTALAVDPLYDPLRNDPRFDDLLRRAHLGDYASTLTYSYSGIPK